MKCLMTLFLLTLGSTYLFAQSVVQQIYLKDGNIRVGSILSESKDSIQLSSIEGNILFFAKSDLDSIKEIRKQKLIAQYKSLILPERKSWFNLFEIGTRPNYIDELSCGFGLYRGYKFNRSLSMAAGISMLYKPDQNEYYQTVWRLGLQNRIDFVKKGSFPFAILELGVQRIFKDPKILLPFYYQAGLGYCIKSRNGKVNFLSIGVTQSMIRYITYDPDKFSFFSPKPEPNYSDWFYYYEPFIKLARKF